MSVLLRTEFGDIKLQFRAAYAGAHADVKVIGDRWKVWADGERPKNALVRILANLTRENYEKLKALGSLPKPYQFDEYFDFQKVTAAELVSLRKSYNLGQRPREGLPAVPGASSLVAAVFATHLRPFQRQDVPFEVDAVAVARR